MSNILKQMTQKMEKLELEILKRDKLIILFQEKDQIAKELNKLNDDMIITLKEKLKKHDKNK